MTQEYKAKLMVNNKPIDLTGFPEQFVAKTIDGAVSSLKQADAIQKLEITLNHGKVKLFLNGNQIALGPFPTLMLANTLCGMVSTLKGVDEKVVSLEIKIQTV